jgi:hypothetical protein
MRGSRAANERLAGGECTVKKCEIAWGNSRISIPCSRATRARGGNLAALLSFRDPFQGRFGAKGGPAPHETAKNPYSRPLGGVQSLPGRHSVWAYPFPVASLNA